jgi:hypothetical protein
MAEEPIRGLGYPFPDDPVKSDFVLLCFIINVDFACTPHSHFTILIVIRD